MAGRDEGNGFVGEGHNRRSYAMTGVVEGVVTQAHCALTGLEMNGCWRKEKYRRVLWAKTKDGEGRCESQSLPARLDSPP